MMLIASSLLPLTGGLRYGGEFGYWVKEVNILFVSSPVGFMQTEWEGKHEEAELWVKQEALQATLRWLQFSKWLMTSMIDGSGELKR